MYKAIALQMYQTNYSAECVALSAIQGGTIVLSAYCGNNFFPTAGIQADLLSIENAVNNQIGGNSTRKVLMESVTGETMLQNQCNMNVNVIIYDIIARQDINSETALNWGPWAPN